MSLTGDSWASFEGAPVHIPCRIADLTKADEISLSRDIRPLRG